MWNFWNLKIVVSSNKNKKKAVFLSREVIFNKYTFEELYYYI